jgi:rhodanese-related sulfurtransferase
MRLKSFVFALIVGFIALIGCVEKNNKVFEAADDMVAAAKAEIKTMGKEEFKALLDNETQLQIVDCREEYDFILGHIPASLHIPRGVLEFSDKLSNRRIRTLVLGNEKGSGALAVQTLKLLKYSDIYLLDFSWFDWEAEYPGLVEQGMGNAPTEATKKEVPSGGCGG